MKIGKIFQKLFLFEKVKLQTKMAKAKVLRRIADLTDPTMNDYYGEISNDRIFIAEKNIKTYTGGYSHNSFAPVLAASVTEEDGLTVISGVLRMNLIVQIVAVFLYWVGMLTVIGIPFAIVFFRLAFLKPARRMWERITELLVSE